VSPTVEGLGASEGNREGQDNGEGEGRKETIRRPVGGKTLKARNPRSASRVEQTCKSLRTSSRQEVEKTCRREAARVESRLSRRVVVALKGKKPREIPPLRGGKGGLQTLKLAEAYKRTVDRSASRCSVVVSRASRAFKRQRLGVTDARHSAAMKKL
jgi:hypothetical protein